MRIDQQRPCTLLVEERLLLKLLPSLRLAIDAAPVRHHVNSVSCIRYGTPATDHPNA